MNNKYIELLDKQIDIISKINNNQDTKEDWEEYFALARASIKQSIRNLANDR
jgi:hypothetical protein